MCLIAIAWCVHPRYRLALIANRDELHARPAAAADFDPEAADVYGGRDLVQGGSWLLASTRGRLAAVTNVREGSPGEAMPRSRGALVRDFVHGAQSADQYLATLRADAAEYGRFNLLVWDGGRLAFASNHPGFSTHPVEPGVHAMSDGAFDAPWPKSAHATRALSAWLASDAPDRHQAGDARALQPLLDALADATPAPDADLPDTGIGRDLERSLSPAFVRDPRYGTRCSTVVLVEHGALTFVERRFGPDAQVTGESARRLPLD